MAMRNPAVRETFLQLIRFGIVGFSNTCFSYGLNVLVLFLLRSYDCAWDYIVANIVSFLLGTLWNFFWHRKFVFRVRQRNMREALQALLKCYFSSCMTGILLANLLSWVWITRFGISRYLAPLLNLIVCVPISYLLNRFWIFGKSAQAKDSE